MTIFNFSNYQLFLKEYIQLLPKRGWGFPQKLAEHLGIHASHISQVLNQNRDFSIEQAVALTNFIGFTNLETDYFLNLVHLNRAGSIEAKNYYQKKCDEIKKSSLSLSQRINQNKILSEEDKSVFYSSYLYSAIRLFCSLEKGVSFEQIQEAFKIDRDKANDIVEFLLKSGLINLVENKYVLGTQHTHVEKGSPHLSRHHINWRIQSLEKIETLSDEELQFTGPVSLSRKDFAKVREVLLKGINDTLKIVKESPAEDIACLNLDLFWIKK